MEKKFFDPTGSEAEKATHKELVAALNKKLSDWHGWIYQRKGKTKWSDNCDCMIIEIPCVERYYERIFAAEESAVSSLPTLAKKVADTVCDSGTREAFKKFAEMLDTRLKKLEEK